MYLVIKDNIVGVVKNGFIQEVYSRDSLLSEIHSGNAEPIESDLVGNRAKSTELVQLSKGGGRYFIKSTINGINMNTDTDINFMEVELNG